MVPSPLFVGIDVAKATLDIAVRPTAETWSVSNDATGIDALVLRLGAWAPTLIVLEATGGYQGPLVAALVAAALPVVVVNPRHIRAFAQAVGILAKTDRIDARVIAHFAEAVKPAPRPLPDAETQELRALLVRRRQLVEMVSAERARLDTVPPSIQDAIQAHIAWRHWFSLMGICFPLPMNRLCHLHVENFARRQPPFDHSQSDSGDFSGRKMDAKKIVDYPIDM